MALHRKTIRKFKAGIEEVKEGLTLARRGFKAILRRQKNFVPQEELNKQDIRDMQKKFRREQRRLQLEALSNKR